MLAALLEADRVVDDDALDGAAAAAHEGENCGGKVDDPPRLRRLRREPRRLPRSQAGLIRGRRRGYVVTETTKLTMRLAASSRNTRASARLVVNTSSSSSSSPSSSSSFLSFYWVLVERFVLPSRPTHHFYKHLPIR